MALPTTSIKLLVALLVAIAAVGSPLDLLDQESCSTADINNESCFDQKVLLQKVFAAQEDATRLQRDKNLDFQTERHDGGTEEGTTDGKADDENPPEEPTALREERLCPFLADVLQRNGCKPGKACENKTKAEFDEADLDEDGRLCPKEVQSKFNQKEREAKPPFSNKTGGASMLQVTRRRLAQIKELFDAGKLDTATHMEMLNELFSDPEHLGKGLQGEEDQQDVTHLVGGEGSLLEGHPAADGAVVNRTAYRWPPKRPHAHGVRMLGWPVEADKDGDRRLSAEDHQQARQVRVHGVSLLDTGGSPPSSPLRTWTATAFWRWTRSKPRPGTATPPGARTWPASGRRRSSTQVKCAAAAKCRWGMDGAMMPTI